MLVMVMMVVVSCEYLVSSCHFNENLLLMSEEAGVGVGVMVGVGRVGVMLGVGVVGCFLMGGLFVVGLVLMSHKVI